MAATINADNGVSSGSAGLKSSADNSGVLQLQTNGTAAVTVDTSQNVGIGTGSPTAKLDVVGASGASTIYSRVTGTTSADSAQMQCVNGSVIFQAYAYSSGAEVAVGSASNHPLTFRTNNTERMRIDTSGNLLVGTTSGSSLITASKNQSGSQAIITAQNTNNTAGNFAFSGVLGANCNTNTSAHFGGTSGASAWFLLGNGTTTYSSDSRLKKNIETARNGYLEDLCQLRVVKYNWANHDDSSPKELGLIAQEVEQVFPSLVQDDLRGEYEGVTYKTLKGSVIPMLLLKAIQEQQALIQSLTIRLTALEQK